MRRLERLGRAPDEVSGPQLRVPGVPPASHLAGLDRVTSDPVGLHDPRPRDLAWKVRVSLTLPSGQVLKPELERIAG
jgi:hypothetical protein